MTFLAPLFLVGGLAAALPIVLHLLKREPETRVKFAVVKLLKRAPVEHTQQHRLRELLLLALRVAALVLLAFAFARPFFTRSDAAASRDVTVVAVDTSYSMAAPGRFERARQLAKEAIGRTPAASPVALVSFSDRGEIVEQPAGDRALTLAAIDRLVPGNGATRYRAALSAASQAMAGRPGTIVVVSDLQEGGWDAGDRATIPAGARIVLADVGALPANLAVTAVRASSDRIIATVHLTGAKSRDVRVHLAVDDRAAGDATASLSPGQSADVTFPRPPRGTAAAVSVDDPDGLPADNVRYAALSGASRPSVLVVNGSGSLDRGAFYLRHALAAGEGGRGYQIEAVAGAQVPAIPEDRLAASAAVIVVSTQGLERRGREALATYAQRGGGLLIASGPDVDGDVARDLLGDAVKLQMVAPTPVNPAARTSTRTLAPADVRHPVFRPFASAAATLGLVKFQSIAHIEGTSCQTLARLSSGDAALIECGAGEGRALVFASDLDNRWNDFPLHATFVPFVHEVVRYLASARAQASEYLVADVPPGVPNTPGWHEIPDRTRPGATRRIVVNVDPRESDGARISADEFQAAVTPLHDAAVAQARVEARQQEDRQRLWQYALLLMVGTLVIEGFVASRTA